MLKKFFSKLMGNQEGMEVLQVLLVLIMLSIFIILFMPYLSQFIRQLLEAFSS